MIYVVDFTGRHNGSVILDNIINGEEFQPLEFEGELDREDEEYFKEYLEQHLDEDDTLYLFIDHCSGPDENVTIFNWLRGNVKVDGVITESI